MEKRIDSFRITADSKKDEKRKPFPAVRFIRRTAQTRGNDELYHPNGLEPFYDLITGTILYE